MVVECLCLKVIFAKFNLFFQQLKLDETELITIWQPRCNLGKWGWQKEGDFREPRHSLYQVRSLHRFTYDISLYSLNTKFTSTIREIRVGGPRNIGNIVLLLHAFNGMRYAKRGSREQKSELFGTLLVMLFIFISEETFLASPRVYRG